MKTEHRFEAIGTAWSVTVDGVHLAQSDALALETRVRDFEKSFSRFLPDSEVNRFRKAEAGDYEVSPEFAFLLARADALRTYTDGVFDPAAGALLERAGYDEQYSLTPQSVEEFELPAWQLSGTTLTLSGPTAFDFGGIGKGYAIDLVAALLTERGYEHFLVDAGGDMYATNKADGGPWRIALEYPGKPDTAAGIIDLHQQGLAVSDSFRRRWGTWHHLVDPKRKEAISAVNGAAAVAETAWDADCMTSVLFMAPPQYYDSAAQSLTASYVVFLQDGTCRVSERWPGELFT